MKSLTILIFFGLYITIKSFNYNSVNITIELNDVNNSNYNVTKYNNLNKYKINTHDFSIELTKRSKQKIINVDYNVINKTGFITFYTNIGNKFSRGGSYDVELICETIFNIYGDYLHDCNNSFLHEQKN
ncbi:hypothetical protein BTW14_gp025 [BeAn 58058 virus]|uniref:hypothetical protein n=1 Tax=BeAn 58058 virus TaxID=67082 RepID=UPI0009094429|nr:hypothetical protein BTW14_gp025 [BeAn 58058 virus]APG58216.1 hypothetical protein BAV00027 [BeAn 58058 virus]